MAPASWATARPPLQSYINRPFGAEFDGLTLEYFLNYDVSAAGMLPLMCAACPSRQQRCWGCKG
jgi:hypothetical protein